MGIKIQIDWQIWSMWMPYRKVWSMTCPNLPGIYIENEDKEYAKAKVVNHVVKYINDCKNANKRTELKPNEELPKPAFDTEVIEMHSL